MATRPGGLAAPVVEDGVADLTKERNVSLYFQTVGPTKTEWQGEEERALFYIPGSASDLRRTTDRQYLNQMMPFFKVITYDQRNMGQSTSSDEPCTMEDYADDAACLLRSKFEQYLPIDAIGVSFGGMVLQYLALRHPDLIRKVVICCAGSGGLGGKSYPIHLWYAPGVTVEERITRKIFQANSDRNEKWKTENPMDWQMNFALLSRDEKIGADAPLREEGLKQQLEARKGHDTWEKLPELAGKEVLVCGSTKDLIAPVDMLEKLVRRIGPSCHSKLDFDWGHPFVAADVTAMPYINKWIRGLPLDEESTAKATSPVAAKGPVSQGQLWKVVGGGGGKGGIIVRQAEATNSPALEARLSEAAIVEELQVKGPRMKYKLVQGDGPESGWVSLYLSGHKELLVKVDNSTLSK